MGYGIVRQVVRARFLLTSREAARGVIRETADRYLAVAEELGPARGATVVNVPKMMGVDEEMRDWSFYMLLEHHVIVNGFIRRVVEDLERGEKPIWATGRDPKHDVLPKGGAGEEQVAAFRESVDGYLEMEKRLGRLRGTETWPHPLFGVFDAHKWHCMFGFHLKVHFGQAERVYEGAVGD
ncbi:MAG: hypothetical protein AAF591_19730 [Verrucomicrobiota bacterium]